MVETATKKYAGIGVFFSLVLIKHDNAAHDGDLAIQRDIDWGQTAHRLPKEKMDQYDVMVPVNARRKDFFLSNYKSWSTLVADSVAHINQYYSAYHMIAEKLK